MTFLPQLTVLAVFIGLSICLIRSPRKRAMLTINAFSAGCILFFIVMTTSTVINSGSEMLDSSRMGVGFLGNAWLFLAATTVAISAIPLVLIFAVGERRRSVIIAIAIGLFNLGLSLSLAGNQMTGLITSTVLTGLLMLLLFLIEGLSMGALLMKTEVDPMSILSLGLIAGLPALIGFNIPFSSAVDVIVPITYAVSAGFMIFYLPFILGANDSSQDIKWHFIGMVIGLFSSGLIITTLTLFS